MILGKITAGTFILAASILAGCGDSGNNTGTNADANKGPAEKAGQTAGRTVDNAGRATGDAVKTGADRVGSTVDTATGGITTPDGTHTPGGITNPTGPDGKLPGMPSVTGTDTTNMSTADAAAQRLIDNARNNLDKQNDISKAKLLLGELKEKGMYEKVSVDMRAKIDQLEKDINAKSTGTAGEK